MIYLTHHEFYSGLTSRVRAHLTTLRDLQAVHDAEKAKAQDSKTYGEDVRKAAEEKAVKCRYVLAREVDRAKSDVELFTRAYADELRARDALNPADLTDDAKLLTGGLPLTAKDYRAILRRSEGNRTMQQLTLRSAKEKGFDLGVVYISSAQEAMGVENTLYTSHLVLDRYAHPDAVYFDKLLGEGSQLQQVFGAE